MYKQSNGKKYESDYAVILYWVTNRVKELERKEAKYKNKEKNYNKKLTFNQREYPPGFFDFLYCNKELKLE